VNRFMPGRLRQRSTDALASLAAGLATLLKHPGTDIGLRR
jgi:hypothetical protein